MTDVAPDRSTAKFWDRIAEGYAKKPVADDETYQKKLEVTRSYLGPAMEVLEFGCGTGSTALAHASHVKHILATDLSAKMIEIAKAKAIAAGVDNVTFEQRTLDDLEAPDHRYDAVLGLNILHLLDDRDAAIAEVHRLLRPGGVFVSSTACIADHMKWFRFIAPVGRFLRLMPTVKVFREEELVQSLTDRGFAIEHRWHPGKGKGVFVVARC